MEVDEHGLPLQGVRVWGWGGCVEGRVCGGGVKVCVCVEGRVCRGGGGKAMCMASL